MDAPTGSHFQGHRSGEIPTPGNRVGVRIQLEPHSPARHWKRSGHIKLTDTVDQAMMPVAGGRDGMRRPHRAIDRGQSIGGIVRKREIDGREYSIAEGQKSDPPRRDARLMSPVDSVA